MLPTPHCCQDPAGRRVRPREGSVPWSPQRRGERSGWPWPLCPALGPELELPEPQEPGSRDSGRHILTCPKSNTRPCPRAQARDTTCLSSSTNRPAPERRPHTVWRFAGGSPFLSPQPPCQAILWLMPWGNVVTSVRRGWRQSRTATQGCMQSPCSPSLCLAPARGRGRGAARTLKSPPQCTPANVHELPPSSLITPCRPPGQHASRAHCTWGN